MTRPEKTPGGYKLKGAKALEVKNKLFQLVESGRIMGVTQFQLEKEFGVTRKTIAKWLKEIYKSIPPEDINVLRVKLETTFNFMLRDAQKMIRNSTNQKEKKEAHEFLLKVLDKFIDFLERFNLKPKMPENINITFEKQLVLGLDDRNTIIDAEVKE